MKIKALFLVLVASLVANFYLFFGKNNQLSKMSVSNRQAVTRKVTEVVDGDTFYTEGEGTVRLAGVDAPETKGCLFLEATERLRELIEGKKVRVEITGKDNFGREIGFVMVEDALMNKIMLEEGLGKLMGKNDPKYGAILLAAEDSARKAKRGVWSKLCEGNGCKIKGNYRKDNNTYIYHLPGCYNYDKIVVNEKGRDRWFCTEEEAIKAGFRKSEDCPK